MINQINLGRKRLNQYKVRDLVRIMISKIDHFNIDCLTFPCKIIKRTKNNQYILGSKFEIINIYYSSREIEPLEIQYFSKFDNLLSNKIFVREAACL